MKILLPIDESSYSQEALRMLMSQFNKRGAQVRVLNVIEPLTVYVAEFVESHPDLERLRSEQSKKLVARTAQELRQSGFRVTEAVESGDVKTVIINYAAKWGADLIIMSSHGVKGLRKFLMGSVSEAVTRHAACSVQVVRSRRPAKSARR